MGVLGLYSSFSTLLGYRMKAIAQVFQDAKAEGAPHTVSSSINREV